MVVYMGVGVYLCVWMRVFKLSVQELKALVIAGMGNKCVYICFIDSGTNCHRCKLWGMSENLICKCVWWARVTMSISKVILCHIYIYIYIYIYC